MICANISCQTTTGTRYVSRVWMPVHFLPHNGTTMKYNLTKSNNFVFQAQGYLNLQRNPKHNRSYIVSETGKADYINRTDTRDQYESPALSMYFKKYLPHQQALIFNVVGTYIHSDYDYFYEQDNNSFQTTYSIGGKKASVIGEAKYYKGFKWGSLTSGIRSFYGNTRNHYVGDIENEAKIVNSNTNAYVQADGRWKYPSGLDLGAAFAAKRNEQSSGNYKRFRS